MAVPLPQTESAASVVKHITVVCTKPRREIPVDVAQVDTAADVLRKAGLSTNDYFLLKPTQEEYQPSEPVFVDMVEGGKAHCVPQSNVG